MQLICCLCNKVKTHQGWLPQSIKTKDRITHGYCPACHKKTLQIIESFRSDS